MSKKSSDNQVSDAKEQDQQTAATTPPASGPAPQPRAGGRGIAYFSLLLALLALAAAGYLWTQNKAVVVKESTDSQHVSATVADIQQAVQKQQNILQQQQAFIQKAQQQEGQKKRSWILAEVEYLVRLANFNLVFAGSPQVAEKLLITADKRVANLHDPSLVSVRQGLAQDLTQLRALPDLDLEGLLLQIDALSNQIQALPIVTATSEQQPKDKQHSKKKHHHHHHIDNWKKGLKESWNKLKNIVVVQYHNKPVGPFLSPQGRAYLDQHLQLLLAQAQWAALHKKNALYHESLEQAISWVNNAYVSTSSKTQAMVSALQKMAQVNVDPPLPDLSKTLQAVQVAEQQAIVEEEANQPAETQGSN